MIPERSRIIQFGKRFDVAEGQIYFNGPATDPLVNFGAQYEVHMRSHRQDDLLIKLDVNGRLENLNLTLRSENPAGLELVDIISYIATGRPASQSLQLGGQESSTSALGAGAGLALNQVAGWVEGVAGSELGLDVIEIEQDGLKGTTITAGKYVKPWFYVSVSQPIAFGNNASVSSSAGEERSRVFTMELEFFNWLMLRVLTQGSSIRSNLLWDYTY